VKRHTPSIDLRTPAVVIDRERMRANVARMSLLSRTNGVALRPHVKTHKSTALARVQMDAGVVGFTASKPDEAAVFLAAGVPSLTVAYPLPDPRTIARLLDACPASTDLLFVVDSPEGVAALASVADERDVPLRAFIEIDVGLGRCGVAPGSAALALVARSIAEHRRLDLAGILSHAGHAYAAANRAAVRAIAERERATMIAVRSELRSMGVEVPVVSVGSTPTVLAAESFDGIDEIRPGNYIFLDAIQVGLGLATFDDVALTVLTTVVSRNASHYIVDAGSKTLSSDRGAHGSEGVQGFGVAFVDVVEVGASMLPVERLSEEHGFVARGDTNLSIGTRLRVVPNHACPVANLADRMYLVDDAIEEITVDARGRVQ
jgi:D-serine deaminase-like pyridoxal phosphate-dependent protein